MHMHITVRIITPANFPVYVQHKCSDNIKKCTLVQALRLCTGHMAYRGGVEV